MIARLQGMSGMCVRIALLAAGLGVLMSASTQTALAAEKSFTCTPADVAAYPKVRVHVRCNPGDGAITYFALGVSSQEDANRVVSLAATAFATKKSLTIWYDPADLSGANIGCLTANCRLILGIAMF
jgi:hypothetical protein